MSVSPPPNECNYPREALNKIVKDILLENNKQIRGGSILRNFEFIHGCPNVFEYNDVFPLQKIQFEDEYFYAPNRITEYLHSIFGDYGKFPEHCCPHVDIEVRIKDVDFSYETEFLKNILKKGILNEK